MLIANSRIFKFQVISDDIDSDVSEGFPLIQLRFRIGMEKLISYLKPEYSDIKPMIYSEIYLPLLGLGSIFIYLSSYLFTKFYYSIIILRWAGKYTYTGIHLSTLRTVLF